MALINSIPQWVSGSKLTSHLVLNYLVTLLLVARLVSADTNGWGQIPGGVTALLL